MKTVLPLFTCLAFSMYSLGCYSLNAIEINDRDHLPEKRNIFLIEKKNNEIIRCKDNNVDSTRIMAQQIELFHHGAAIKTIPLDSVKTVYSKDINKAGTITLGAAGLGLMMIGIYLSVLSSID